MNSRTPLFGSFPPPSREDWLHLSGSDFSAELEPGLAIPALLALPQETDQLLDRSVLLHRDPLYRDAFSVRTDTTSIPDQIFAAHSGYRQIALRAVQDAESLDPLSADFGLHLTPDHQLADSLSIAMELAAKRVSGSFATRDPKSMPALFEADSPAMSPSIRESVWIQQNKFRLLGINLDEMRDESESVITRVALACAWIQHLIHVGKRAGIEANVIAKHLHFSVPLSNTFWLEIAFLRSIRVLIHYTLRSCGVSEPPPSLITAIVRPASSSNSDTQAESELIRYSAIATAAMIGGADMIAAPGLQVVSGADDEENQRMLASTQLALIHESGLAAKPDPAGGGYYVETLSQMVASAAWDLLLDSRDRFHTHVPTVGFTTESRPNK